MSTGFAEPRRPRSIFDEIREERWRQDDKYDNTTVPLGTGIPWNIHTDRTHDQVEGDWKAWNEGRTQRGSLTFADILMEEVSEALAVPPESPEHLREELVQVAAVAVAMIERIDKENR